MWLNVTKEVGNKQSQTPLEYMWTVCEKSSLHIFPLIAVMQ